MCSAGARCCGYKNANYPNLQRTKFEIDIYIVIKNFFKIMAEKKPKKNPTFGNGDARKATGQCRSQAQKNASNRRKKK